MAWVRRWTDRGDSQRGGEYEDVLALRADPGHHLIVGGYSQFWDGWGGMVVAPEQWQVFSFRSRTEASRRWPLKENRPSTMLL